MKTYTFLLGFLLFAGLNLKAQQKKVAKVKDTLTWHTNIVQAAEISNGSKKPIFAFFTGSDWCGWCKKLQNDVFSKPEFIQWANKNVVLVELDFPRGKSLSPELQQQNSSLQQTFRVQGYPTIWLFYLKTNPEGSGYNIEAYGSLGYPSGAQPGKEQLKFIKEADATLAKGIMK